MKRILLIGLFLLAMVGTVSAYGLYLNCTEEVAAGASLKCSVDSDFPPGTTFNLVLYQSGYTATQIRKQAVTIQTSKQTQYIIVDTTGLPGGTYKAEMQYTGADEARLRSDSVTMKQIRIIDRSSEIEITSPVTQDLKDALRVEGEIKKLGNNGVQIEVSGPDGRVFGPQWIQTKNNIRNDGGIFTQKVAVTSGGDYTVQFSDAKGYVGSKTFTVVAPTVATTVPTKTATVVKTTRTVTTTVPTPWPTTAQSPISPITAIAGTGAAALAVVLAARRIR